MQEVAAENHLGLRLVAKFADGLHIRSAFGSSGVAVLQASSPHVLEINRTLAAHGATLQPVLAGVGAEWEALVARAERLSGRAQPDLRAMFSVHLEGASAAELVAAGMALSLLEAVEFTEIEYTGMAPPGAQLDQNEQAQLREDCAAPDKNNRTAEKKRATPDFASRQGYYRGPEEGGFDAEWAATVGADGAGVRYSDCEYCWIWDHE